MVTLYGVYDEAGRCKLNTVKTRVESAPGVYNQRLNLKCDEPLSYFAFNFNVRRYDEAAYDAAFTAGRDPPRVDYTEPTLCGVSSWTPLVTGPMLHCKLPPAEAVEEDTFADQTDHKGLNTGSQLRADQMVTEKDGTKWRVDPSFDGAFVDMHLGMDGLTMQLDNHFGGDK